MPDAPSDAGSILENDDDNGDEEDGTPAAESEVDEGPTTPVPQPLVRKKKLGRPPKNRPADWDQDVEPASESGTPRRGRGRGGFGKGGGYVQKLSLTKKYS
jgi:chromatin structure-remodeling complex protein RSC7